MKYLLEVILVIGVFIPWVLVQASTVRMRRICSQCPKRPCQIAMPCEAGFEYDL